MYYSGAIEKEGEGEPLLDTESCCWTSGFYN